MKPFGNKLLNETFHKIQTLATEFNLVFDGELWSPLLGFTDLSSCLRSHRGDLSKVEYHIFDAIGVDEWNAPTKQVKFIDRYVRLQSVTSILPTNCKVVQQITCLNATSGQEIYAKFLAAGCEGVILRSPTGLYKNNRCTHRESNCFKFKHFQTDDAVITEVIQRRKMLADTDRTYNPLGLLEKINTSESYELDEAVGAFTVLLSDGRSTSVNLGRGFSYRDRQDLWLQRDSLVGRCVEFKWMPHGTKDLPRIGSVVRFRPDKD